MKNCYPKIKFPYELTNLSKSSPKILSKPELPVLPIKECFEKPKDFLEEPNGCLTSGFISMGISGIGMLLLNAGFSFGLLFTTVGGIMFFYYVFGWRSIEEKRERKKSEHLKTLKEYKENIANAEFNYKLKLQIYNNNKSNYENECKKVEDRNIQIQSQNYIDSYRFGKIKDFLLQAKKPSKYNAELQKGITHKHFGKYLNEKFTEQVFDNLCLINTYYDNIIYIPDYIIYDKALHLFIDIEIDEPYIGNDGTPIHFINSKDNEHDDFILQNRWIVIRFAEIQIIQTPNECCKLIETVINNIKKSICNDLTNQFEIELVQGWSKEDSYKFGFNKYRHSYLPKELQEILHTETLLIDKNNLNPKKEYLNEFDDLPF